jgi:protoporphyrinogen oxidase
MNPHTLIIGAGPAGLTAASELVAAGQTDVLILEASQDIGGLSKTVKHHGNRIDIGGHRFFSKSDWVMNWWREVLPIARPPDVLDAASFRLQYQGAQRLIGADTLSVSEQDADVMLVRNRLSRIYWGGQFYDYPLKPGLGMVAKLGVARSLRLGGSYAYASLRPIAPEATLEDFLINRFGRQLYLTFFKEYTEKVWGVPCREISAAWGAQRIKSLSIGKALVHAARKALGQTKAEQTSLIEHFLYPKLGPGQMWETVAARLQRQGVRILHGMNVTGLEREGERVSAVLARDADGLELRSTPCHVVSTMPIKDLVQAMRPGPGPELDAIAAGLQYRDFITVGLLYRKLSGAAARQPLQDNWIYIQDTGVKVGRLQIFNNWSPFMVADPGTVWVGLEFFARDDDALWGLSDAELRELAIREMAQLNLGAPVDVLDATVLRMPKAYPGYFGAAYERFNELQAWLDGVHNLYLVGRNGMHRYNNQDHSMLSARAAVQTLLQGGGSRAPIWAINVDDDYHEG